VLFATGSLLAMFAL